MLLIDHIQIVSFTLQAHLGRTERDMKACGSG